jgi:hypothetical protein
VIRLADPTTRTRVRPFFARDIAQHEENAMKKKTEKTDGKKGKEKILTGKYWYDPTCGPIRP